MNKRHFFLNRDKFLGITRGKGQNMNHIVNRFRNVIRHLGLSHPFYYRKRIVNEVGVNLILKSIHLGISFLLFLQLDLLNQFLDFGSHPVKRTG
ncbi:hypothetical protein D3C76_1326220 [compost metagenome]